VYNCWVMMTLGTKKPLDDLQIVTDHFRGGSGNANYLIESEEKLRGGSFKDDWGGLEPD
jgi:hypothetical protein